MIFEDLSPQPYDLHLFMCIWQMLNCSQLLAGMDLSNVAFEEEFFSVQILVFYTFIMLSMKNLASFHLSSTHTVVGINISKTGNLKLPFGDVMIPVASQLYNINALKYKFSNLSCLGNSRTAAVNN